MFRTDYYEKLEEYGQSTIGKNTKLFMNLVNQFAHHLTVAMSVNIKALPKNIVLEVIREINTDKDIYRVPFKVLFIEDQAFITKDGYVDSNRTDPHVYELGENYPYKENKDDDTSPRIYTKNELDKAINEALAEYRGTPEEDDYKDDDEINEDIDLITLIYKQISYTDHWEYPQEILAMIKDVIKYNLLRYVSKENYTLIGWYNKNKQLFEFTIGLNNVDSDATGELYSNLPDLINLDNIGTFELSSCGYVSTEDDD